jgi:hypothetical protein
LLNHVRLPDLVLSDDSCQFDFQDYMVEDFKSQGSHIAYAGQEFSTQVEFQHPQTELIEENHQDDLL